MKRVVLLISVVHLLLAFSSPCATATTNQLLPMVRDTNGSVLLSGARYFMVSALIGVPYRGVSRDFVINGAGDANLVCPSRVVETPKYGDFGIAVSFKPKAGKEVREIAESIDVNIVFYNDNPTICDNVVWEVEGFPGHDVPMFLSTNGVAGNLMKVSTWFQIKKNPFGNSYKLVFCPYGEHICSDIGIKVVDEQIRLAIGTDNTFRVYFIKDDRYGGIKSII